MAPPHVVNLLIDAQSIDSLISNSNRPADPQSGCFISVVLGLLFWRCGLQVTSGYSEMFFKALINVPTVQQHRTSQYMYIYHSNVLMIYLINSQQ